MNQYLDSAFPDRLTNDHLKLAFAIIDDAQRSEQPSHQIAHKHHIVPRIWFECNGLQVDNSRDNIVQLSLAEHIAVHYHLMNYYKERNDHKMMTAMAGAVFILSKGSINTFRQNFTTCEDLLNSIDIEGVEYAYQLSYIRGSQAFKKWRETATADEKAKALEKLRIAWANKPQREKDEIAQLASNWWNALPEDEKQLRLIKLQKGLEQYKQSLTPEELYIFNRPSMKMTREQLDAAHAKTGQALKKYWSEKSEDEKQQWADRIRKAIMEEMDPEKYSEMRRKQGISKREDWDSRSEEEQTELMQAIWAGGKKWWDSKSKEERSEIVKSHMANMTEESKQHKSKLLSEKSKRIWKERTPEQRQAMIEKYVKTRKKNYKKKVWIFNPTTNQRMLVLPNEVPAFEQQGFIQKHGPLKVNQFGKKQNRHMIIHHQQQQIEIRIWNYEYEKYYKMGYRKGHLSNQSEIQRKHRERRKAARLAQRAQPDK